MKKKKLLKKLKNINKRLGDLENSRGSLSKTSVSSLSNRIHNNKNSIDILVKLHES